MYLIECQKCKLQYIGETERPFKERIGEHKIYIRTEKYNQPIGEHFNRPGHHLSDMKVTILEKIMINNTEKKEKATL